MRNLVLVAALLPAACATAQAPAPSDPPVTPGGCRNDGLDRFVGQPQNAAVEQQLKAQSGARVVRWAGHDMAVTMDYREDRLTVRLDQNGRIATLSCG